MIFPSLKLFALIVNEVMRGNNKKGHVKFFIDNYAIDHYYMDNEEWKAKKKSMKTNYSPKMTLEQLDSYATSHNIPALSFATRQTIGMLKQW